MILMVAITVILMFLTETSFTQHRNFAIIHYFGYINRNANVDGQSTFAMRSRTKPIWHSIFFLFFYLFCRVLFSSRSVFVHFGCHTTTAVMHCGTRHRQQTDTNYDVKIDSIIILQIQYAVLFTASLFSFLNRPTVFFLQKYSCS